MENGKYIRTLRIIFSSKIRNNEIPLFRGAILSVMKQQGDILFHNHISDNVYNYSYPLIQYKKIRSLASIVAIEEGTEVIGQLLNKDFSSLRIGAEKRDFQIESVIPDRIFVQVWQTEFNYRIRRWLALNSDNYLKYLSLSTLIERITLLETILKGNLLSICKGLGIYISEELIVKITSLSEPYLIKNKGVKIMAFDIEFASNLSLPNFIGVGKNASIGYGIITKKQSDN